MEKNPRTLQELEERFMTEAAGRDYLARLRWGWGFVCPACDGTEAVGHRARALDVHGLWAPGVGDGGHDLRGHAYPADALVPGDLVGGQPEERRQRLGLAARPRFGQLPHGLDVAAQAPPRDGAPGSGLGGGRGGRNYRRRGRAGRGTSPPRQESPGGHCRRGAWPQHRPNPDAAGGRCVGRKPAGLRAAVRRAGHRCDHRRAAELPRPVEARLSPRPPRCAGQWRVDGRGVASHSPGCCAPQALAPGYTSGRGQP